ncbi:alpha/beta hydrolase [Saccharothrix violaceirubra]|uniref:Pimeloyl-ACP methyl ester carboxylesterase n=1 Tax=Saccharothrix violaceirubra TaxID=413306 RepID=A0A7W7WVR5_9PSEU|nr:alpha/beta fold hydrolase [Saccharothrix violaceirubra]MBB4965177.1 pimeloyl-ACP methyl ester carboxylesterase [Saccharothrix violaceirubra]
MWKTLVVTTALTLTLTPAAQAGTGLSWRACGDRGAECADVSVPLDWSKPGGDRVTVAISRIKATDPARRLGVLFFNPGGPGGPAVPIVRDLAEEVFPARLRERFDIIGIDPRGVGDSRPAITCDRDAQDPAVDQFPTTQAGYQALVAHNRAVADGCRRLTGPLIDHVDTISAARDLDVVRAGLGERKISWLGVSYGTLLGATYAGLFPNRVRAAVLDGAVDHTIGSRRLAVDEARTVEQVFAKFAKWCRENCGRDDVAADYRALLARAAEHPVPATGHPEGVNAQRIGYVTYSLLSSPKAWPVLAEAIAAATAPTPDAQAFAETGDASAYRVIACHDFPSDVRDHAGLRDRVQEIRRIAPTTRGHVEGWDVQAGCTGWPIRSANPWAATPVRGVRNVLVVSGAFDPATPHVWGIGLACQIEGARMLHWSGVGHTAYFNDDQTRDREVEYLLDAV